MVDLLYKTYSVGGAIYGFIDMAIVIIEGSNRDMGTTYTLLNEVITLYFTLKYHPPHTIIH